MYQAGLVLEGGGMKGLYTAGVLDYFIDKNIDFSSVYGVSAGACNMCSYLSKQRGRARDVNTDYLGDKNYCSLWSLITTGDLFNVDFCYRLIPDHLNPFDHEKYKEYKGKAYSVVTNVVTGQAEYLRVKDSKKDMNMIQASASLPLMARNVKIGGKQYLDGGIADPIPIAKSILDGNRKNVVVLTKEEGYVRKPTGWFSLALIKARYLKYPKIYELMAARREHYNETMEYLYRQVENGQAYVIRPKHPSKVGRIEKNREILLELYQQGYDEAAEHYEALMEYLGKETK